MQKHVFRSLLAAVISIFLTVGLCPAAKAASQVSSTGSGWEYEMIQLSTGKKFTNGVTHSGEGMFTVTLTDGTRVPGYCIDPTSYMSFNGYTQIPASAYELLSSEVKSRLNLVTYFGYEYGGHTGTNWYLATQTLVSDAVLGGVSAEWTNIYTLEKEDFADEIAEINALINAYTTPPSFDLYHENGTKASAPDEFHAGELIRVSDPRGKLSSYRISSVSNAVLCDEAGNPASADGYPLGGQTFWLRLESAGEASVNLVYAETPVHSNAQFILRQNGAQDIITCGALAEPMTASLKVTASNISIYVRKTAAESPDTSISGAVMKLRDETDPSLSDESWDWTSGSEPHECRNIIPDHTYVLSEVSAPDGRYLMREITIRQPENGKTYGFAEGVRDEAISKRVLKMDARTGRPLAGVTLQLKEGDRVLHEWVTDENPLEIGGFLQPGHTYSIHEAATVAGYYFCGEDLTFTVDEYAPDTADEILMVSDEPIEAEVLKTDAESGEAAEGAVLQLLDAEGNILHEWTAGTEAHSIGMYLLPDREYRIHEVSPACGYYYPAEDTVFSVSRTKPAERITVQVSNSPVHAAVLKKDAVTGKPLSGVVLQLIGETEQVIHEWTTDGAPHEIGTYVRAEETYRICEKETIPGYYFQAEDLVFEIPRTAPEREIVLEIADVPVEYRVRKVNENGRHVDDAVLQLRDPDGSVLDEWETEEEMHDISGLLLPGKTYLITEKDASLHYYLAADLAFTVPLTQPAGQCAENPEILTVTNRHIKYRFAKTDENGNVVEGAHLAVYDITETNVLSEDNLVFDWASTSEPVSYNNLERGHTYKLVEYGTVQGHYAVHDQVWTVPVYREEESEDSSYDSIRDDDGLYITVTAVDIGISLTVQKVDEDGNAVAGAALTLRDETDGEDIASYVSTEEPITVDPVLLAAGHTYSVRETAAPAGYYPAAAESVTIPLHAPQETPQLTVVMTDRKIEAYALKTDPDGSPVAGAELAVLDASDERELISWVSETAPFSFGHVLSAGKTYILREKNAPDGYHLAEDIRFTVSAESSADPLALRMEDQPVEVIFHKQDRSGASLAGAQLQLLGESGEIITAWESDGNPKDLSPFVKAGGSYTIHEVTAPVGWHAAEDIPFEVPLHADGKTEIIMQDMPVHVTIEKTDEDGNPLSGASFIICDEDGNAVDSWTSDGTPHEAGMYLQAGRSYTVREVSAPDGYYFSDDAVIDVSLYPSDAQRVEIADTRIRYQIMKCDEDGNPVSGVRLRLYDAEDGTEIPLPDDGMTGEEPFVLDGVLKPDHSYTLCETEIKPGVHPAPDVTFHTSKNAVNGVVSIRMIDQTTSITVRKTDEDGNALPGASLAVYEACQDEEGNWSAAEGEDGRPITAASFVSGEEPFDLSPFVRGDAVYILHETEAPDGYVLSSDIIFRADGTGDAPQCIVMTDAHAGDVPETGTRNLPVFWLITAGISVLLAGFLKRKR